jgi:hypothetical protein
MGLTLQDLCQVSNIRFKEAISISLLGAAYFNRANFRAKKKPTTFWVVGLVNSS